MPRRRFTVLMAVCATLASSAVGATALRDRDAKADGPLQPVQQIVDNFISPDAVDDIEDIVIDTTQTNLGNGTGETLVLVIGAQVPTYEASQTLARLNGAFGEIEGFAMDAATNYELTGAYLNVSPDVVQVPCTEEMDCAEGMAEVQEIQPIRLKLVPLDELPQPITLQEGSTLVLTSFRTKRGAEEFLDLARALRLTDPVTVQARKTGGGDVGLGQEPHPDGSGPLLAPLVNQGSYQR